VLLKETPTKKLHTQSYLPATPPPSCGQPDICYDKGNDLYTRKSDRGINQQGEGKQKTMIHTGGAFSSAHTTTNSFTHSKPAISSVYNIAQSTNKTDGFNNNIKYNNNDRNGNSNNNRNGNNNNNTTTTHITTEIATTAIQTATAQITTKIVNQELNSPRSSFVDLMVGVMIANNL